MDIRKLKKEATQKIQKIQNVQEFETVYREYFGKKGKIFLFLSQLKELPLEDKKEQGRQINNFKIWLKEVFDSQKKRIQEEEYSKKVSLEKLDITQPSLSPTVGHLHPLSKVFFRVEDIFQSLGFSIVEGPEIEDEYHNFDALNIPKNHPARDQWDTFWLKGHKKLLRTHTSPVQIRYMEKHYPPFRIIAPGRCFRHEATDASHDVQFNQLEGLMVGKDVSIANFKAVIEKFLDSFFGKKIEVRMRPGYFPFTEPSFEIDLRFRRGPWLEILGAGMVHPNVFRSVGYESHDWQGFAFGMGLDRLAMLKYHISDIRLFYNSDLRFIQQF